LGITFKETELVDSSVIDIKSENNLPVNHIIIFINFKGNSSCEVATFYPKKRLKKGEIKKWLKTAIL
jgi:hypothetical protein